MDQGREERPEVQEGEGEDIEETNKRIQTLYDLLDERQRTRDPSHRGEEEGVQTVDLVSLLVNSIFLC